MDYHALVSSMGSSSSTRKTADVTIKEGLTIDQVFELLDDRGVTSADKLRDMAANYDYAFDWLRERPWAITTGWRATCSRTPIPLSWGRIPNTSSTRCW